MFKNRISVINFDRKPKIQRRVEMFPNVLRCGIFGPSGSGKSNVLLSILLHVRPFFDIYLCSKTSFQDKYNLLRELIDGYNDRKRQKQKIRFHSVNVIENLPEPETVERNSVIIFDDILTENQDKIANFFLRGRHRDISCFYLSQAYTKIPKKKRYTREFQLLDFISPGLGKFETNIHRVRFRSNI